MKKSIFVTTIIMALVIVLAMTTATFAWFSTSQNVTVSGLNISARTVSGAQLILRTVNGFTEDQGTTVGTGTRTYGTWQSGAVALIASGTLEPLSGLLTAAAITSTQTTVPTFTCNTTSAIFHKAEDVVVATNEAASVANQSITTSLLTNAINAGVNNDNFVTSVFQITDSNYSAPAATFSVIPSIVLPDAPTVADRLLSGAIKVAFYQKVEAVTSTSTADNIANYDTFAAASGYELVKIWAPNASVGAMFYQGRWIVSGEDRAENPVTTSNAVPNNTRYLNGTTAIGTSTAYSALITDANSADYTAVVDDNGNSLFASTGGLTLTDGIQFSLTSDSTASFGKVTEVVIVIWLDGLDQECVNGASGGSLSLSLVIS